MAPGGGGDKSGPGGTWGEGEGQGPAGHPSLTADNVVVRLSTGQIQRTLRSPFHEAPGRWENGVVGFPGVYRRNNIYLFLAFIVY